VLRIHAFGASTLAALMAMHRREDAEVAGLGLPVENRYGLRPAAAPDGSPAPIEAERGARHPGAA
jgi:hypothetical protein